MKDPGEVAAIVDELDLAGVECFYPAHDRAQTRFLVDLCRDRGLAATASSDFHGPSHKMFNSFGAYSTYDLGEPALPPRPPAA
jgi:predicted metal-dependent phosphoesterase TrpH